MKKLFLLCGVPGSGKSTWAQSQVDKHSGIVCSRDAVRFSIIKDNEDYINYCKNILENITSCRLVERKDYNTDNSTRKPQLRLESRVHPFFTTLHDRIYTEKYKGLDPHAFKLFDWECLAILFMCDGCGCYKRGYKDYSLNLKRLSYGDQLFLKKQLKDKLDLEWNINKNGKIQIKKNMPIATNTDDIPIAILLSVFILPLPLIYLTLLFGSKISLILSPITLNSIVSSMPL